MAYVHTLTDGSILCDEFRINRLLGSGGFANTYHATDLTLQRDVAIKEFFPNDIAVRSTDSSVQLKSDSHSKHFDWGRNRFLQEARTLAKFRHPNIVRVFRTLEANSTAYMVLDFVRGTDMDVWLNELGRRPTQAELDILVTPLLEAMSLVHTEGIFHRDVKPANIFIREDDGTPVLLDFGAARFAVSEAVGTTAAIVSRGYSAHEAYSTEASMQGAWTDIYGFAATLYRALSGEAPPESAARVLHDTMVPAAELPLPPDAYRDTFLKAVDWGLSVMPKARPQAVEDWRPSLGGGEALPKFAPTSTPPRVSTRKSKSSGRRAVAVAAKGALAASLAVVGYINHDAIRASVAEIYPGNAAVDSQTTTSEIKLLGHKKEGGGVLAPKTNQSTVRERIKREQEELNRRHARLKQEEDERKEREQHARQQQEEENRKARERAERQEREAKRQARLKQENEERRERERQARLQQEEADRKAKEAEEREERARLARRKQEQEEADRLERERALERRRERIRQARLKQEADERKEREHQARLQREEADRLERERALERRRERIRQARLKREEDERQARLKQEEADRKAKEDEEREERARLARRKQEQEEAADRKKKAAAAKRRKERERKRRKASLKVDDETTSRSSRKKKTRKKTRKKSGSKKRSRTASSSKKRRTSGTARAAKRTTKKRRSKSSISIGTAF